MEEWRQIIVRFDLAIDRPFRERLAITHDLTTHLIDAPAQLSGYSFGDISGFSERCADPGAVLRLWQSVCITHGSSQRVPRALNFETNAILLAQSARAPTLEDTGFAISHKRDMGKLGVPPDFDKAGPAAKARLLAEGDNGPSAVQAFSPSGAPINVLRQAKFSMKSIASGIQCWVAYCNLAGQPHFPPTSDRVCVWGTLFQPGGSFTQYVAHLAKACQLLDIATDWRDSSAVAVPRGLRKAHDLSFKFGNYIFRPDLVRFIEHERIESEFGLLGFLSFLFLLRVQSECLPIRRGGINDRILERTPRDSPALLGIREFHGETRLVLKLNTRKNCRYGIILMRPCFCDGGVLVPGSLCPIHAVRPAIRGRVLPGELISPSLQGSNINRILKAVFSKIGPPDAEKYTTYAFRRGCLVGLKRSQSTVSQITKTAGRPSARFKVYLDLSEDEEAAIGPLLRTVNSNEDSDQEDLNEY